VLVLAALDAPVAVAALIGARELLLVPVSLAPIGSVRCTAGSRSTSRRRTRGNTRPSPSSSR
jgi:hypothetical protein